ncbi:MAG: DUF456 domain-containing protein [Bacteroidaceae bacterium]|nr:DUF456 domain-containing protein [Bacteroidaceae bacterium]
MDFLSIIALLLGVIGIIGGFLPVLPGPPISWCAILCLYFRSNPEDPVTMTALLVWLAAATIITILDYVLPGIMTKVAGGHKSGSRGATVGMIIGIFFSPIGMIIGSFLGAYLCEKIIEAQDSHTALKAAVGSFLAFLLSSGIKVIFGVIAMGQVIRYIF